MQNDNIGGGIGTGAGSFGSGGTGSGGAGTGAAGKIEQAKEFVGEKYEAAASAVKGKYTAVKDRVGDVDFDGALDQVRSYVRANPGAALLMSVGVGFVVGLLLRRDND